MTYNEKEIFERALETFGFDRQVNKLLEEMAELQVEIQHYRDGRPRLEEIAEEMADVQIMLDQMTLLFQNAGLQQQYRQRKVERLRKRLEGS
jgi:NTP pyrophosphatase (non-canonical NTP hydrolase)